MSRPDEPPRAAETEPETVVWTDRIAGWALGGPLSVLLALLCVGEFACWAPNYLTWPFWADHDVFATAALSWDRGILPYRDFVGNNFPGTIYIFSALGRVFGFGWPLGPAFFGFDACLVGLLGLALTIWSRRVFGAMLPGLVAYSAFLGYYLNLDYSVAAQRDWHGPVLAVLGLFMAQSFPGHVGRVTAGLACAFGMVIRPQTALLLPAVAWAISSEARSASRSRVLALLEWSLSVAAGLGLGAWPLIAAGIWPDFLQALKVVAFGSKYNNKTPLSFLTALLVQFFPVRLMLVPIGLAFVRPRARLDTIRAATPWLWAWVGAVIYAPLSPHSHAYLAHPIFLVWSVLIAFLVAVAVQNPSLAPSSRLVVIILIFGLGTTQKPRFCNPLGSLRAWAALRARTETIEQPTGYLPDIGHAVIGRYAWEDYRATLEHLRATTSPTTKIANALEKLPAVTGPVGHLSAFPAESIAWLRVVLEEDEGRFADSLRAAEDSVVIWAPSEAEKPHLAPLPILHATIRELYEPDVKFGPIEVWKRKAKAQ